MYSLEKFAVHQPPNICLEMIGKTAIELIKKWSLSNFMYLNRRSRPDVFFKKDVFTNSAKFRGKHLCQSLFFNKVSDRRPATLLKKRLWHRCFPVNFAKFLRIPFLTGHLWWLLLFKELFLIIISIISTAAMMNWFKIITPINWEHCKFWFRQI